jgi:small-conductance mechanosensitive channel
MNFPFGDANRNQMGFSKAGGREKESIATQDTGRNNLKRVTFLLAVIASLILPTAPLWGEKGSPAKGETVKEAPAPTAPVLLDGTTIFSMPGRSSLTAEHRTAMINERIARIADNYAIRPESIKAIETDISTDIVAEDQGIMSVFDSDARAMGAPRQQLAGDMAGKIRLAIEKYREARTPKNITHGVIISAAATLLFILLLYLARLLRRRVTIAIDTMSARPIRFQNFELIRTDQVKTIIKGGVNGLRLIVVLLLLYLYLQFVLSAFPWTEPFSGELLRYLLVPLHTMGAGLIGYIPNLIFLVVLVFVTQYLLKFMRLFAREVEKGNIAFTGFYPEWAKPTYKIARFVIIALAAVVAFPYFPGSESPAFKGISIFLGVLLSLGSSSTVSNMIAGLDMTYRRACLIGDWVKIGDLIGEVTRMRLLVSHLRTFKNEEVVIPNAIIQNSHVTNYSSLAREHGLILHTAVTIGYNTPWRQVHAFLLQAAERTAGVLRNPPPFVLQTALDDFYVRYELNIYTDAPQDMQSIYSNLHLNIQDAFNEYGVQIMSPHYIDDPKSPAVVPKERWYEPPARPAGQEADNRP